MVIGDLLSQKSWVRPFIWEESHPTNNLIKSYTSHRSELLELLGMEMPKTYLILLMNSAEKKPHGGFFGSYATITIDRHDVEMGWYDLFAFAESVKHNTSQPILQDVYYPLTIKKATLPFPAWMSGLIELPVMTFLGANRLGFTDMDGSNIQQLYEQTFGTQIDGVIFVNDKLFSLILPDYEKLKTKRQFQNTYADQIAQTGLLVKKKETLNEMRGLLSYRSVPTLIARFVDHLSVIQQHRLIQVYIPAASSELQELLVDQGWMTPYQSSHLFLRDMSFGLNKIDRFVTKTTTILSGDVVLAQTSGDILEIPLLLPELVTMQIQYQLSVPSDYIAQLTQREQHFDVTPHPTQRTVLGQDPQWFTQGIVHLPSNRAVISTTGSAYRYYQTQTPFSLVSAYRIASKGLFADHKTITMTLRTRPKKLTE